MPKFGTKYTLRIFRVELKKLLYYMKSALSNSSNCKKFEKKKQTEIPEIWAQKCLDWLFLV